MTPLWPGQRPSPLSRAAGWALRSLGWTALLPAPPTPKVVLAFAPHTSNLDFWVGFLWRYATGTPARFVAKRELFRGPGGAFLRAVGGVALDRAQPGANFVERMAALIRREPDIALLIAPEGQRARAEHWKSGFYHMALSAEVPVGLLAFDWGRRRVGVVGYLTPSGDIEADFAAIRALLDGVQGRHPQKATPAYPRPAEAESRTAPVAPARAA